MLRLSILSQMVRLNRRILFQSEPFRFQECQTFTVNRAWPQRCSLLALCKRLLVRSLHSRRSSDSTRKTSDVPPREDLTFDASAHLNVQTRIEEPFIFLRGLRHGFFLCRIFSDVVELSEIRFENSFFMFFTRLQNTRVPELMDDPLLDRGEHLKALQALHRINFLSYTAWQVSRRIASLLTLTPRTGPRLQIVDLACGGGDVTIALSHQLHSIGIHADILGIDKSPVAVEFANQMAHTRRALGVRFISGDVVEEGCPPCDIALSTLFLHHLSDDDSVRFLHSMHAGARVGGVVSDLLRSRRGLLLAMFVTKLLTRSHVVRIDGPLSVRAARTHRELQSLITLAGINRLTLSKVWPERLMLCWNRKEAR